MDFYQNLIRPIFFSMDAEEAHDLVMSALETGSHFPALVRLSAGKAVPSSPRTVAGITFPNPVGLAAGMDKNGLALPAWEALGFGFIEVGTITARAHRILKRSVPVYLSVSLRKISSISLMASDNTSLMFECLPIFFTPLFFLDKL